MTNANEGKKTNRLAINPRMESIRGVPMKSVELDVIRGYLQAAPQLDPWESRIVKIFVTILMQINLTNARALRLSPPSATKENKSISGKASNFSIATKATTEQREKYHY